MKKAIICSIFGFIIMCVLSTPVRAAEIGDTFDVGDLIFTVLSTEGEKTVALSVWNSYYDDYGHEVVIPKTVEYKGESYTVTEITRSKQNRSGYFSLYNASVVELPSTIKKFDFQCLSFETHESGCPVRIILKCHPSALAGVTTFEVNSPAIESVIYVPEEYYEEYKTLIDKVSSCTFYDTEDMARDYCGIKLAKIGEEDVMPLGFIYDGSSYKVLDEEKGTVALIKADSDSSCFKNGLYDQPEKIYYKDKEFTVTEVDYFAFFAIEGAVKLPKSITKLAKECMGQYVTKLDLSETKVKTIPSDLFLNYGDNDDSDPIVSEVILPKCCKKIEAKAFYRCKSLKSITIPKKVTKIGKKAFNKKCKSYYIKGDAVPAGLEIQPMKKATIYVKSSLLAKAKKILKSRISAGDCLVKKK